jgi:hypothetical protein
MKKTLLNLIIAGTFLVVSCEGPVGPVGLKSLMNILNEPAGSNCPYGGLKIEAGVDENKNELLEPSEVDNTNYVCNGQPGNNGSKSLIKITPEPSGTNCSTGGYRLDSGLDLNANNILDSNEIQSTTYLCNGLNGAKSLMTVTAESQGTNCPSGGYKLENGLDINNNNILDATEITSTRFICNGSDKFDKVTVLDFGYSAGTTSANWSVAQYGIGLELYNFNIDNYPGVDSVVFVAFLGTYNTNSKCFVELFDKTDNIPINNSILESNRFVGPDAGFPIPFEMKQTGNIYHGLPHKVINLTFSIRSEIEGIQAITGFSCYLYLYKR